MFFKYAMLAKLLHVRHIVCKHDYSAMLTYRCHRAHTRADAHLHKRVYVSTIARNGAFHFHVALDDEVRALFQNVERGTWRARWMLHNVEQVSSPVIPG